ncbi:MAG: hypothetical protein C5B58_15210, partial [Acidobacteria bacterium]
MQRRSIFRQRNSGPLPRERAVAYMRSDVRPERASGVQDHRLASDDGTEFVLNAILRWADDHQIARHEIAPGKPVQNAFTGPVACATSCSRDAVPIARTRAGRARGWWTDCNTIRPHARLDWMSPIIYTSARTTATLTDGSAPRTTAIAVQEGISSRPAPVIFRQRKGPTSANQKKVCSMKKRFFLCLLSAAAAVVATYEQSQSSNSEAESNQSSIPATPSRSPDAATRQQVIVQVQASTSVVLPGQKIFLFGRVTGTPDQALEWSMKEGEAAGSITLSPGYPDAAHNGPLWVYTASNTPGTYHVTTKALADPLHPVTTALVVQPFVSGCTTRSDEIGVWHNITPHEVDLTRGDYFGMQALVVDPINPSTIYVGRAMDGIYRSTDCGANWKRISTGRNSRTMASGRTWTMVIDPSDPQTIYTNQGYGESGVYKTSNGGLDWDQILTPNITAVLPYGGFVG